ncbi:MAG: hypothetical protein V3V99_04325 [candidate division Zixibacteria bacterium]
MLRIIIIPGVAIILSLPGAVKAQFTSNCLDSVQKIIGLDKRVKIYTRDSLEHSGRLMSVSSENSLLMIFRTDVIENTTPFIDSYSQTTISSQTIEGDRIIKIEYYRKGRTHPAHVVVGFFLGGAAGQLIEMAIDPGYDYALFPFKRPKAYTHGQWIGAAAGTLAGIFLPMLFHTSRTLECDNKK